MRRRRKKFEADTLPPVGNVSNINNAALLLFIGHRIYNLHLAAEFNGFIQIDEPALSIHNDRLARLSELVAVGIKPAHLHANAPKDAGTAPLFIILQRHRAVIVHQARIRVN